MVINLYPNYFYILTIDEHLKAHIKDVLNSTQINYIETPTGISVQGTREENYIALVNLQNEGLLQ